jgi:uncharacterized protein (TIGR02594 family)
MKPIELALSQIGVKELPGRAANNKIILAYFKAIGQEWVETDETAWCSAFINWCCKLAGYEYTGELTARSWLKLTKVDHPVVGDIVVYWREHPTQSWKGHVGFFCSNVKGYIYTLSGNQDNMVCVKPYFEDHVLGYVRPKQL